MFDKLLKELSNNMRVIEVPNSCNNCKHLSLKSIYNDGYESNEYSCKNQPNSFDSTTRRLPSLNYLICDKHERANNDD